MYGKPDTGEVKGDILTGNGVVKLEQKGDFWTEVNVDHSGVCQGFLGIVEGIGQGNHETFAGKFSPCLDGRLWPLTHSCFIGDGPVPGYPLTFGSKSDVRILISKSRLLGNELALDRNR